MASRRLAQLPHLCEVMHVESSLAAWPTFQGPGPFYVGGAMSGTSLDGLDLALVKFWHQDGRWRHELVQSTCLPYDQSPWAHRLPASYSLRGAALDEVSREYSQWLNAAFHEFFDGTPVQAIASHGHTVHHRPSEGLTRQIGQDPELAQGFGGLPVVCDFRVADVDRGGQGAPLVPLADAFLYSEYAVCLNLGGFSNASWTAQGLRRAGDLGPVNLLMNHFAQRCGHAYDQDGAIARSHPPDEGVLAALQDVAFYHQAFPKSLGREWVEATVLPIFKGLSPKIALSTATHHAAWAIHHGLQHAPDGEVLVTGGGAKNAFLRALLEADTHRTWQVPSAAECDFKEAVCFAFLGLRKLRGEINVWGSVTGAALDGCDGTIHFEYGLSQL